MAPDRLPDCHSTSATSASVTNHSSTVRDRLGDLLQRALLVRALHFTERDLHDHRSEDQVNAAVREEPGLPQPTYGLALDDVLRGLATDTLDTVPETAA